MIEDPTGDTSFQQHHIVVAPTTPLFAAQINTTRTSTGGYALSDFRQAGREQATSVVQAIFGSHILTYKNHFVNAVSTEGIPTAADWYDATVELMSEQQVYGSRINGVQGEVNARRTLDTQQFAAFRLNMRLYKSVQNWWLRDVVSDKRFAAVGSNGLSLDFNADSSFGIRPYFLIG